MKKVTLKEKAELLDKIHDKLLSIPDWLDKKEQFADWVDTQVAHLYYG